MEELLSSQVYSCTLIKVRCWILHYFIKSFQFRRNRKEDAFRRYKKDG